MSQDAIAAYVRANFPRFMEELAEFCRIPSVSAENRGLAEGARFLRDHLTSLGLESRIMPMGGPANPPLVHAAHDSPSSARRLLVYGHFDVQPAGDLSQWDSDPFAPMARNGFLYGRGTSDAKAQVFAHLKAIETLRAVIGEVPVSLRMLLDPQEEIGTPMMQDFVMANPHLVQADFGISADGEAFEGDRTTLTFGNRGNCYLTIRVRTANADVHSGVYGGVVPSAAWRLVEFLRTLRAPDGKVLIEGFYDGVEAPSAADEAALAALPVDGAAFARQMGIAAGDRVADSGFWRRIMFEPTCNLAGFSSGYGGEGTKTIIPSEATIKLEMRLVGHQDPVEIEAKVKAHAIRHGFPDLEYERGMFYRPSRTPTDHPLREAVAEAVRIGFGHEPLIVPLSGGSGPRYIWSDIVGIPMIEIAYAQYNALAHAPNENMAVDRFRQGILTSACLFQKLARA